MASLTQVAEVAEVSRATASLVLNRSKGWERISEDCRQRVRAVAKQLGYRTNYHMQSIRRGRANIVGFVVEVRRAAGLKARLGHGWWDALRRGAEGASHDMDFDFLTIRPSAGRSAIDRAITSAREGKIDAIIAIRLDSRALVPDIPTVVIESERSLPACGVSFDHSAGVRMILEHLQGLGHRELLWFGPGNEDADKVASVRERLFISNTWDLGMRGRSWRVASPDVPASPSDEDDYLKLLEDEAARSLDSRRRDFTAVVAYSDYYAIAMCRALLRRGIEIPRQVSVVGFDDLQAAICFPPLTTIDHCLFEMGYRACELAIKMVVDKEAQPRVSAIKELIAPRLVIRQSTAAVLNLTGQ
jgi:LacI family transcriptional regulator